MKTKLLVVCLIAFALAMPAMAQETKGNVIIHSTPTTAAVYVNGEYAGVTPLNLTLNTGNYEIRIIKEGHYEFVKNVVVYNNTTYVNATLTPISSQFTPISSPSSEPAAPAAPTQPSKFRVAPIVKIRPVNDVVTKNNPGLIEFYFSNPTINDVVLTVDVYVSVPAGVHVSGEGFSTGGAAGTIHGHFVVPAGSDRTVYMNVVGEKIGNHIIHAEVIYYPRNNRDNFQQISLTHPFDIKEPVEFVGTKMLQQTVNPMWIILIAVVLGGIAIIFGMRRKPPKVEIEET